MAVRQFFSGMRGMGLGIVAGVGFYTALNQRMWGVVNDAKMLAEVSEKRLTGAVNYTAELPNPFSQPQIESLSSEAEPKWKLQWNSYVQAIPNLLLDLQPLDKAKAFIASQMNSTSTNSSVSSTVSLSSSSSTESAQTVVVSTSGTQ
eukprot:m.33575 g.33575  ORF g.33575 m.33575 type:complete len:147 (-) comp16841_c0_seq1:29-469(-)